MDIKALESIAASLKAVFPVVGLGGYSVYDVDPETVFAMGRLQGGVRYTCKYEAKENAAAYAIECAYVFVDGVKFEAQFNRPLVEGESLESDWRSQEDRDAASARAAEAERAKTVITPPRAVFCGESRWAWLEVD